MIERLGHSVGASGIIHYDEKILTWPDADERAGFRLDRRKAWAFVEGRICESVSWSQACTGCYEGYDSDNDKGMGCSECGYQGRVRNGAWVPADAMMEARK